MATGVVMDWCNDIILKIMQSFQILYPVSYFRPILLYTSVRAATSWNGYCRQVTMIYMTLSFVQKCFHKVHTDTFNLLEVGQINSPVSEIPQCIRKISHNTTLHYRNVHFFFTKWCIVGNGTGTLWDLCDRSILSISLKRFLEKYLVQSKLWMQIRPIDDF